MSTWMILRIHPSTMVADNTTPPEQKGYMPNNRARQGAD
jgi:hypothetical protein